MNGVSYESLYNGGGVAIGDLNNDNLPDIYFISNIYSNKLFINNGDLTFKESTSISKVKGNGGFPTGVTMVDINADGLLDIYICKSGDYPDLDYRRNELYINKGNNAEGIPTFIEDASSYGLDLPNKSGLFVKGDVKNAVIVNTPSKDRKRIIFGKNDGVVQFVEY